MTSSVRLLLFLFVLMPGLAAAISEDDLLPVEEAFALNAQADANGQLRLQWDIADGYYLYRHRLGLDATSAGIEAGELLVPDGTPYTDEFFGDVETYRDRLVGQSQLRYDGAAQRAQFEVRYQGCADVGVCYPPQRLPIEVALPALAATDALPPSTPGFALDGLATDAETSRAADSSAPTQTNPLARLLSGDAGPAPLQDDAPGERPPPLPEDQAFVFEAIALGPTQILARFTMPRGYYLYRDNTLFSVAPDTAVLAAPQWPQAQPHVDDHFGEVQVYFDQIEVPIDIAPPQAGSTTAITLSTEFQGCQLDGICYPPMQRNVEIDLPAASAEQRQAALDLARQSPNPTVAAMASPGDVETSATDRLTRALTGGGWLTLGGFFVAGLLLAFTPCVLPMVPILSGLIAGAGTITTRRAFVLSLVYVLSTAVIFTLAGVVAGMAGQNLQAVFQKPWILISFAGLFVLLSLSMFGFYELQLPARWQTRLAQVSNRQGGGSLRGVAIMGVLSALIVGPCVAPPLAAAVAYIGQTGDPVLGGAALFSLAMGMGAPLLVVGTGAGRWLPRAGAWMDTVKAVFGVAFLFLAWWMLERILPPAWTLGLLGALLIACAVYLGAMQRLPDHASGWRKLWQALGVLMLVLGAAQVIGALAGARDYLRPLAGFTAAEGSGVGPAAQLHTFERIASSADLDLALQRAASEGRPVLFDFYADWCVECKRMERYTFPEPAVQRALDGVTMLKVDVTAQNADDVKLQQRFGIIGPPATLFFREQSEQRALRLVGYEGPEPFARRIQTATAAR